MSNMFEMTARTGGETELVYLSRLVDEYVNYYETEMGHKEADAVVGQLNNLSSMLKGAENIEDAATTIANVRNTIKLLTKTNPFQMVANFAQYYSGGKVGDSFFTTPEGFLDLLIDRATPKETQSLLK